jgi:hypothetical protein
MRIRIAGGARWITVSLRMDDPPGTFAGVLLALIESAYFSERYHQYSAMDVDVVALYDPSGRILGSWQRGGGGGGPGGPSRKGSVPAAR